ncbi:MAG: hypothetical protein KGS47_13260 [Chloroflexi bacterium]|nr:hypothetical protein [Chloroflexota bacterium]
MDAFLRRHGLLETRLTWQVERLRSANPATRAQAARELAEAPALLAGTPALSEAERLEVLRDIVAQLPVDEPAAARPRLEMARRWLADGALHVEAMRAGGSDAAMARAAMEALSQAGALLQPLRSSDASRMDRADPLAGMREGADLLDAWRRVLQAWVVLHGGGATADAAAARVELERAIVLLSRLVDADERAPDPSSASRDLLRTELGAEAALGLAVALQAQGDAQACDAWLQAVQREAPSSAAAARVPSWRLAHALDDGALPAIRGAIERMPPRSLTSGLARSAARAAARGSGPDATAVMAAAMDAMDAPARASWLRQLAGQAGALQPLAAALERSDERMPAWRERRGDAADAGRVASELRQALAQAADAVPDPMRADALRAMGWSLQAAGDGAGATEAFERAGSLRTSLAPECLWMAAQSDTRAGETAVARRVSLLRRLREIDPVGPWEGRAATWLSRMDGLGNDPVTVAVLLEVPASDSFMAEARAEAARRILRQASGESAAQQAQAAQRVLRVTDACAATPSVARWRLIAATTPGVEDRLVAEQALQVMQSGGEFDAGDLPRLVATLRLQVMQGSMQAVQATLEAAPPATRGALALAAAYALADMQAPDRLRQAVVCAVMAASDPSGDAAFAAAARDRLARAMLAAADANVSLDATRCATAFESLDRAPAPTLPGRLAAAEALRLAGRGDEAVDRLQSISGTQPQGSAGWMESRWRLFQALRDIDPTRAQAMLRQHMQLLPDGGPLPWGERFRQAAAVLPEGTP